MKTFKEYLDEVYKQRPNSPAPSAGGTIQSQGPIGSKRPTVKGQNANQADMDAGKEQPDEWNNKSWPTLTSMRNVDKNCEGHIIAQYPEDQSEL